MSALYGQSIGWHDRSGTFTQIEVDGFHTPEDALEEALTVAGELGWKPPRWWQWWRWGDRDYSKVN